MRYIPHDMSHIFIQYNQRYITVYSIFISITTSESQLYTITNISIKLEFDNYMYFILKTTH